MAKSLFITAAGEELELLAERALYWPEAGILALADLHLGRGEIFRQNGLALPGPNDERELMRISRLVQGRDVSEILVLGDFLHSRLALGPSLIQLFRQWRESLAADLTVLLGNHDRGLLEHWPTDWRDISVMEEKRLGPFCFRHEPQPEPGYFTWAGHIHPMVKLSSSADRVRLPCFYLEPQFGLLPAFSSLAGGHAMRPGKDRRIYAIAGDTVLPVGREPFLEVEY